MPRQLVVLVSTGCGGVEQRGTGPDSIKEHKPNASFNSASSIIRLWIIHPIQDGPADQPSTRDEPT